MTDGIRYRRIAHTPELILSEAEYSGPCFEPHFHHDFHIGLVSEGVQCQRSGGQQHLLGRGQISVMPPGEVHDGAAHRGSKHRMKTFRLESSALRRELGDVFERPPLGDLGGAVLDAPRLADELLHLHTALFHREADALACEQGWLSALAGLFGDLHARQPLAIDSGLSAAQWRTVRDYCRSQLGERIALAELAALCGLSRFQFLRRFERSIGMTPAAWLKRTRLETAREALVHSEQAIGAIAAEVGFYDQSHFNRAFKCAFGVAPSKFRAA